MTGALLAGVALLLAPTDPDARTDRWGALPSATLARYLDVPPR